MSWLHGGDAKIGQRLWETIDGVFAYKQKQCHITGNMEVWTVFLNFNPPREAQQVHGTANLLIVMKGGAEIRESLPLPLINTAYRQHTNSSKARDIALLELEAAMQQEYINAGLLWSLVHEAYPKMIMINDLFDPNRVVEEDE